MGAFFRGFPTRVDATTALERLGQIWCNPVARSAIILATVGLVVYSLNQVLDDWAYNNYTTNRKWDWNREIVLITGGSSGIGEDVVRRLAKQGIKVIVFDINHPKEPFPPNVHFYKVDITSREEISRAAKALREDVGHPTVLVNNAGIALVRGDVLTTPLDVIERIFAVNTLSHFTLAQEFVPDMVAHDHGHVITISSLASYVSIAGNTEYSCTKASAMSFHEGLRQDLICQHKVKHVRTSIIHPYFVKTALNQKVWHKLPKGSLTVDVVGKRIVQQILRGKSGKVFIPGDKSLVGTFRAWPDWLQDITRRAQATGLVKRKKK